MQLAGYRSRNGTGVRPSGDEIPHRVAAKRTSRRRWPRSNLRAARGERFRPMARRDGPRLLVSERSSSRLAISAMCCSEC